MKTIGTAKKGSKTKVQAMEKKMGIIGPVKDPAVVKPKGKKKKK